MIKPRFNARLAVLAIVLIVLCGCYFYLNTQRRPTDRAARLWAKSTALPKHALRRLGSMQFVPPHGATDRIEYSPDGKYLATAGFAELGAYPAGVAIWELETGKRVTPFDLASSEITGISWAPEGRQFVTSHRDSIFLQGLRLWTVGNDDSVKFGQLDGPFHSVAWSPRGDRIAACLRDEKQVLLFDVQGRELHRFPFGTKRTTPSLRAIDFTPDGQQLAIVTETGIAFQNVADGKLIREIAIDAETSINAIRLLPRWDSVAIATTKGVQIRPLKEPMAEVKTIGEKLVFEIAVSQNEEWLAFCGSNRLQIWDLKNQRLSLSRSNFSADWGSAFSRNEPELALGTERISFIKADDWKPSRASDDQHHQLVSAAIAGNHLWVGEIGRTIREWDYDQGTAIRSFQRDDGTAAALALIGEKQLAVAGAVPEIELREVTTGKILSRLPGHTPATHALGYSGKHRRLISAGQDNMARIWNLDTKQVESEISIATDPRHEWSTELVVAPNGESFVCGKMDRSLQVVSVSTGKSLWKHPAGRRQSIFVPVAFTPDSLLLASVSDAATIYNAKESFDVRISSVATGAEVSRLPCDADLISALAISPDGRFIAICATRLTGPFTNEREIQIWSLSKHTLVAAIPCGDELIRTVLFSADSNSLITLFRDTTVMVWDLQGAI